MRAFHSDNAPELLVLRDRLASIGTRLSTSKLYTPHSKGIVEQLN